MKLGSPLSRRFLACFGFAMICLAPLGAAAERQCTCRYAGQSYVLGACVCIDRPGAGQQYACCGMVLNNTSWQFSDGGCPVAMSVPAVPAQMSSVTTDVFGSAPESALPRPDRR